MTVESASYAVQLSKANPGSSDPRSNGDDHIRTIKTVLQTELSESNMQWAYLGIVPTYVSGTVFTVTGDKRTTYTSGRRIKVAGSSTIYGTIETSTYSSVTAVTINFDSGALADETFLPSLGMMTELPIGISDQGYGFRTTEQVSSSDLNIWQMGVDSEIGTLPIEEGKYYKLSGELGLENGNDNLNVDFRLVPSVPVQWKYRVHAVNENGNEPLNGVYSASAGTAIEVGLSASAATTVQIHGFVIGPTGGATVGIARTQANAGGIGTHYRAGAFLKVEPFPGQ